MHFTNFYFFFFILICWPAFLSGQNQDYLWPTDASHHLTSTFGETRSAHFHSGLDIKTWGREGYKVFASKDGLVYRMGVSARGYGRVIYLKHEDGSFTVYAHLQRLADKLQSYVDSVRMLDFSFEVDLYVESTGMEVKQGEVIGYTGSTGIGPPHLHFETRTKDDIPFNSLKTNLEVQDNLPPTISALLAIPLSEETTIRGKKYPQLYYPESSEDGISDFGVIEADGPVGLTVSTFDEANGVTNKYAAFEITLNSETDTLFHERLDSFSFNEAATMFLDRLPAFGASRRSYQTLYPQDGPRIPFYEIAKNEARILPSDSLKNYTVTVSDFYGNTTTAAIGVVRKNFPSVTQKNSVTPDHTWYWTSDWATNGDSTIDLRNPEFGYPWDSTGSRRVLFTEDRIQFFSRLQPDTFNRIITPDQRLALRFLKNTFFDTLTVATSISEFEGFPLIDIQPGQVPFAEDFEIRFNLGDFYEEGSRYALFRLDRYQDRIKYVDSEMAGRTLLAYPSSPGEFIVVPDNEPPLLSEPRVRYTDYGKWLVHIPVTDNLSKINFQSVKIIVNGKRGIAEYDFEENLLIYNHPDFKPNKINIIEVTVSDVSGNRVRKEFSVRMN